MQKGVLIFDGDIAIEKRVYSGDTEDLVSALCGYPTSKEPISDWVGSGKISASR